jgi:hypothetical protein
MFRVAGFYIIFKVMDSEETAANSGCQQELIETVIDEEDEGSEEEPVAAPALSDKAGT